MLVLLNAAKRTRMPCAKCKQAHAKVYKVQCTHTLSLLCPSAYNCTNCRSGANGTCTDQMSCCNACYFAEEERPLPSKCGSNLKRYRCAGRTGAKLIKCLKRWGSCVKKAFRNIYGKVCIIATLLTDKIIYIIMYSNTDQLLY